MRTGTLALAAFFSAIALPAARGSDDWPQYRGPQHDGISRETGWMPEGAKEPLWTANVGLGYSAVAVSGGRLYTQGHDADAGLDVVYCLDAVTGEELWSFTRANEIWNQMHTGGTLTTPSVDGERVYVIDRDGVLVCLGAADGQEIWRQDVKSRYEVEPPTWGFSASPLLIDGKVIVNVGKTVALDPKTGETLWQTRDTGHAYSTPVDFRFGDDAALAVFNGSGLAVFGVAKGDERFFHEWKTMYDINAASPVVVGGDKLFISSGLNRGCALIAPANAEKPVVFESKEMRTKMSGCVLSDGHLYGFDEDKLKCIDLAGAEKWTDRDVKNGALVLADGKLLILSHLGELIVANASPEKLDVLSRAQALEAERSEVFWTTPVLANGLVYCRSSFGKLVCRDHRAQESKD